MTAPNLHVIIFQIKPKVKMMPNWITKTTKGTFICLSCCGLAVQTFEGWICVGNHCERHEHALENQSGVGGITSVATIAGTTSVSPSPSPKDNSTTTT